ncbi:GreA/GreB family elongation factor [Rhodococcus sp. NCIMB 12038]|uniref:GreA/GreB family elongation factor n=1 Tax=Rhodococcus sp. NCIMB 12038 TaxID=933800 RepID=UPI000B3CEA9D|nr:GreA/GreB family elongation factor [Rhodococcus sp. NCIMB 12038]OUS94587.1 hypothetical protein CA951_16825 [Rhodococcus sp. NCIMB 12038]
MTQQTTPGSWLSAVKSQLVGMSANAQERRRTDRQIRQQRDAWAEELRRRTADRSRIELAINDERCGGDPAESEGSRLAMKARFDNESRISELTEYLSIALPTRSRLPRLKVRPGSIVTVQFDNEIDVARFVMAEVSHDVTLEPCAPNTPLGGALIGCRLGTTVEYAANGKRLRATVVGLVA